MAETIRVERGRVTTITIERPDAANALDRPSLAALADAIGTVGGDPGVRPAIVTGSGDKAFCAGADLKERATMSVDEVRDYIARIRDTLTSVERLPQPAVAA